MSRCATDFSARMAIAVSKASVGVARYGPQPPSFACISSSADGFAAVLRRLLASTPAATSTVAFVKPDHRAVKRLRAARGIEHTHRGIRGERGTVGSRRTDRRLLIEWPGAIGGLNGFEGRGCFVERSTILYHAARHSLAECERELDPHQPLVSKHGIFLLTIPRSRISKPSQRIGHRFDTAARHQRSRGVAVVVARIASIFFLPTGDFIRKVIEGALPCLCQRIRGIRGETEDNNGGQMKQVSS